MSPIKLLLSDVDGTLVRTDKTLSPATITAVQRLREHGVEFAITSGRTPRGTSALVDPLAITTAIAATNGACVVTPDLDPLVTQALEPDVAASAIALVESHSLSPWVCRTSEWYVLDHSGPHVDTETRASGYPPTVVATFDGLTEGVTKIVGVSDDADSLGRALTEASDTLGDRATVTSSQIYYLDITHPNANKGWVLRYMAATLGLDPREIATIGDGQNDIAMFELSGLSIAIDGHNEDARARADHVTANNDADGFARAVDEFVLPAS